MTISTFSLPIDIPWERIAFSEDMMDKVACDRELPLRWRSSVAVFAYEPPKEQQRTDGFIVSYLKVACTITGYQAGKETRIRERLGRSGWKNADLTSWLEEAASKYYPCHGAMLEVVVAPRQGDAQFTFDEYPYFADFDPKKRELYEVVTETGETMSRSLEDVKVRLGQTTLQSHEVRDKTTLGAGLSASYMGVTASGSVASESGTTDLSQHATENVRTTDASRELRESFSHTTQLSQLYHQLDSYHLGTNRAAFFVSPRPHVVQSPATFVKGPREIEGVQEFMLVVVRPKEMEEFCVEAYLETAHLTGEPILDWDSTDTQLHFKLESPDQTRRYHTETTPVQAGYIIDRLKGPQGWPLGADPRLHGATGGYQITSFVTSDINSINYDLTVIVGAQQVTITGWVEGWKYKDRRGTVGGTIDLLATVFLKKKTPTLAGRAPGLLVTARAVCSCRRNLVIEASFEGHSIVYEKSLGKPEALLGAKHGEMSYREANQLGADLKQELLQSLSSADRYPRGTVGLLDSQLFSKAMGTHIRHADQDVNARLSDWPGINKQLARRVMAYAPSITRSELLEMPLAQQVEKFGLAFTEAVELRRTLTDIAEPQGPPPVPERSQTQVPALTGLHSVEAHAALSQVRLVLGAVTVEDSPLPPNTVVGQRPEAGTKVDAGSEVSVQVASGLSVRLPDVLGLRLSEAACSLRDAGLQSEPVIEGRTGPDAEVAELEPPAATFITPNSRVTIRLKRRSGSRRSQ